MLLIIRLLFFKTKIAKLCTLTVGDNNNASCFQGPSYHRGRRDDFVSLFFA